MQPGIKVFAPASVGNVAVGFDVMGFALEQPGDEIIVRFGKTPGLRITNITGAQGKLSFDPLKNTAGLAALKLLNYLGESGQAIEMELHKKMPIGSGLGSSAASAVCGVMAINELLKRPLDKKQLLPFALQGEHLSSGGSHADNVAPSLMGGLVLIRDNETLDFHRLPVPNGLFTTVVCPHVQVLTKDARSILSATVPLEKFIQQNANFGAFIIGLYNSDIALIGRALQDVVIEPQRAKLIPHFYAVKDAVMQAGALGCSISGAGPSIFALSSNSLIAEEVGEAMKRIYIEANMGHDLFISPINQEGAIKL